MIVSNENPQEVSESELNPSVLSSGDIQSLKRKRIIERAMQENTLPPVVREFIFQVSLDEQGATAEMILSKRFFSVQCLKNLRKYPGVLLQNGEPMYITDRMNAGDQLTVRIVESESSENIPPRQMELHIVYEDEDILVVNKPAGIPTHPSHNHHEDTLANGIAWYYQQQNRPFVFRVITRLDRDTSGLVLIAKHYLSAARLGEYLTSGHKSGDSTTGIVREYLAICQGIPEEKQGTITAPIGRVSGSVIERRVDFENGEEAITHYQVVDIDTVMDIDTLSTEMSKDYEWKTYISCMTSAQALVRLRLQTGRTHQIRVHMKHIGHPLLGDVLYNPEDTRMTRQALHSYHLAFPHPITGEAMDFICELPEDMRQILFL